MAVYTDVTDTDIQAFAAAYDLGRVVSFKGIAEGVENSNYALAAERGHFVLTLYERRVDAADLPYFLGLMDHLAQHGLPCPVPVKGTDGEALRTLCDRPAALFTWLDGLWPRDPDADQCRAVGRELARVHEAGKGFAMTRRNRLSVDAWSGLLEASAGIADSIEPGLADAARAALDTLAGAWPTGLPAGHIHADLFPDNVFFTGPRVTGLIDFYFACEDAFAYDIAVTLNAWACGAEGAPDRERVRALVSGYESVRALQPEERRALPRLAEGAAMRFFLTRLFDWANTPADALVVRKDPMEYWRRARFHARVTDAAELGLEP